MPKTKNQGKNKSRFEVRGGLLNEYEFSLNEGAMTEEEHNRFAQAEEERQLREGEDEGARLPISPQEREAARIRQVMETAHEKAQRNIEKRERREAGGSKGSAVKARAGKASKAVAGKKAAGKSGGKATASKKGAAGKSAQKRGAAGGAGKSGAKAAAKKSTKKVGAAGGGRGGASGKGAGGARKGAAKKGTAAKSAAGKGGRSRRT
ncbi:MAG TPA: hypothetical protein VF717_01900 [Pyrinomonadaceae bacterium]|jgi:hypothetical protein